jgi:hypothetical protein
VTAPTGVNPHERLKMSSEGHKSKITALLAAAALSGCAGNGNGLDANGNPITPGGGGSTALTADFQSIQDNLFTPICTRCHIGASAPQGLQLDADHSYALLVGVPSTEQPSVLRVEAGDPDSSYIVRKLQGSSGISGERMPLGGPYLDQSTIDVIRQWITNGASKTATAMSIETAVKAVQRFTVKSTSPDNDSIVSTAVPQIVVAFNGDIDSTMLNSSTVTVVSIDTIQYSGAPQALPVSIGVPAGNPAAILIKPRIPLANGIYRVTLRGSLANMGAAALGNDYSFTFTVEILK